MGTFYHQIKPLARLIGRLFWTLAAGLHVVICNGTPPIWCPSNSFEEIDLKATILLVINIEYHCQIFRSVITYDALSEEDLVYLDQLNQEIHPQLSLFDLNRYII